MGFIPFIRAKNDTYGGWWVLGWFGCLGKSIGWLWSRPLLNEGLIPGKNPRLHGGWTRSISHYFETMVDTILVSWYVFLGNRTMPGVLRFCATWSSSIPLKPRRSLVPWTPLLGAYGRGVIRFCTFFLGMKGLSGLLNSSVHFATI